MEQLQSGRTNDTGSLVEPEQVVSSFSEASSTVGGLGLWITLLIFKMTSQVVQW